MLKNSLSIQFPKQMCSTYHLHPLAFPDVSIDKHGTIPKTNIPSDTTIKYISVDDSKQRYNKVNYYKNGETTKLEEYTCLRDGSEVTKSQKVKNAKNMSVKTNMVSNAKKGKEYSSIHILDRETGVESFVRRKGKEIIGGYDVIPTKRTFAQGFKGRLQKLGMTIATDVNGCERPVLKNIGEMILKVAKRIK